MKILMIPSWYPTPQMPMLGTFYKEQAEAMAAAGAQVAVIYADVNGRFSGNGTHVFTENGVYTILCQKLNVTPRVERGRVWQRTAMLRKAFRHLCREWGRPDVVNLRSSLQGYEALALCRREQLPLFFMEHSSVVLTEGENTAARRRLTAVMQAAGVNACVSEALRAVMQPIADTRVIPDLVDDGRFVPMPQDTGDTFRFRAMGQLRPIKGYDTLIAAFATLCERTDRAVRLEIAGAGALREQLQQQIADAGLSDVCRLVGIIPREETPRFMNGCDCFICSSRHETLSCVLNEAAACGKPLISTRCGGPADIITATNGLLVAVDDVAAMAEAMERMLCEAERYSPEAIRAETVARFGKEAVSRRLLAACEEAIAGGAVH
ncbi:MAG: glycosyltransferase family 4 protein [Ruminococcaceae bacterium]|nr:glycosyltransferase family 4 protein [Oscillospiraceae bacterium]